MNEDLAVLIEAYLDCSISVEQASDLAARMHSDPVIARCVRDAATSAGLIASALERASEDDLVRAIESRLQADSDASAVVASVRAALPARRRRPRLITVAALAAMAAAVIVCAWWLGGLPAHAPADVPVQATLHRADGTAVGVHAGSRLGDGPVSGVLVLQGEDTRLELTQADLRLERGGPGARLALASGMLTAVVAHQPIGAHFTIATPDGEAVVVGTRFTLAATSSQTRLKVDEGMVRLISAGGGASAVSAGSSAVVPERARLKPPQSGHAPLLPLAVGWQPLFPGPELAGWMPVQGSWHLEDGAMVGADPDGGWSRLRTDRDLGDFALRCRLRILGKNYAEIQVLDYQRFLPITPDLPGSWQDVRVAVNAGRVTATCNGLAIETGIGIDSARERFGPLSFYVRAGARLEVRDAQFRELSPASSAVP